MTSSYNTYLRVTYSTTRIDSERPDAHEHDSITHEVDDACEREHALATILI